MNPIAIPIILINRIKHLIVDTKRIPAIERTIISIKKELQNSTQNGMVHYKRVYNVSLYIMILEYDVAILKNDALLAIRRWKKKYIARQLAVLLYEVSHDLPKLLGKDFRQSLNTFNVSSEELEIFNTITKQLNRFKNENHELLKMLRNYVGAHRDNDASMQLQFIENIELVDMLKLSSEYYKAQTDLAPIFTDGQTDIIFP